MDSPRSLPIMLTLLSWLCTWGTGCWYRHVVYDFDSSNPDGGRCVGSLAEIHPNGGKHALRRTCRLYAVPPLYYCTPPKGFESELFVLSKTPAPVEVTIDYYRVVYGDPPVSVEACTPPSRTDAGFARVHIAEGRGTNVVEGFRFQFEGEASTARIEIGGAVQTATEVEPFECGWVVRRRYQPLTWTFPFRMIE